MALASEMKNLSENILASFKERIKENEELVNDVQKTLDGFRKDHQEMAAVLNANAVGLRKGLAQGEKDRLNTYKGLMDGINTTISTIQKEVAEIQTSTIEMINGFGHDRVQMAKELNKFFAQGRSDRAENEKNRIEDFNALMKNINNDLKSINNEVLSIFKNTNDMLARFDNEHKEMSDELRTELSNNLTERVSYTKSLLLGFQKRLTEINEENQQLAKAMRKELANSQSHIKKGEAERLVDYNTVMKEIQLAIKGIRLEVKQIQKASSSIIEGYSQDRSQAATEWNKMQETIAQIKKTGVVKPTKKVETKTEITAKKVEETPLKAEPIPVAPLATEAKKEIPPVKVEKTPAKVEPEPVAPLTIEEKILNYVNKHPKGVKISEMEVPLNETRMKLGFVAKKMLDDGKVLKIENIYYPRPKK